MSSGQLIEQRLRLLQIARVEAFGEPAVDRSEQIASVISLVLLAPEPGRAHRGAEFPGFGLFGGRLSARPEYDFAFAMLGFGELSSIFPAMPDGLAIVKRFDRIIAADDAAFLDPAIEA
jgi:hypothetical protein